MPLTEVLSSLVLVSIVTMALVLLLPPVARTVTGITERTLRANQRYYLNLRDLWQRLIPKPERQVFWRRHLRMWIGLLIVGALLLGTIHVATGKPADLLSRTEFVLGYPLFIIASTSVFLFRERSKRGERLLDLQPQNEQSESRSPFLFWLTLAATISFGFLYRDDRQAGGGGQGSGMVLMLSIIFLYRVTLTSFVSLPVGLYSNGVFSGRVLLPWDQVAWYRWYEHRDAVLFGTGGQVKLDRPFLIVPVPPDRADETNRLLEERLPEKQLPDVEVVLAELESSASKG